MPRRGRLFVISGPAGVGKSEIVKTVLRKHPDVKLSVSCTTRAPRPGEVDGVSYHFVTEERFHDRDDCFLPHCLLKSLLAAGSHLLDDAVYDVRSVADLPVASAGFGEHLTGTEVQKRRSHCRGSDIDSDPASFRKTGP